ncbi:hypothetical protein JCM6882_001594 [Rhodosporidiobolus microsporus]
MLVVDERGWNDDEGRKPFKRWCGEVRAALRDDCLAWSDSQRHRFSELCKAEAEVVRGVLDRGGSLTQAAAELTPVNKFVDLANEPAGTPLRVPALAGTVPAQASSHPQSHLPPAASTTYYAAPHAAAASPYPSHTYQAPSYTAEYAAAPSSYTSPVSYPAPQYAAAPSFYSSHIPAAAPAPNYNFWEPNPALDEWGNVILPSNPFDYEEPHGESSSSHHQYRQHSLSKGPAVTDRAARRYGFGSGGQWKAAQGW